MSSFTTGEQVAAAIEEVFARLDACLAHARQELERRPLRADAWSKLEHLEHVSLANHFLLLTIGKGCRKACRRAAFGDPPAGESDLELLSPMAVPGAFQWIPPSHMLPTGNRQPEEIRSELSGQRDRCRELLAGMAHGEGRLCTIYMSVHGAGKLDMYQWLYFLVQHASWHLAMMQKEEEPTAPESPPPEGGGGVGRRC